MSKIENSIYTMGVLEDLSEKKTSIHRIHPLIKLLTTLVYLITVISYGRYEISSLLPFVFYPILILSLGEIPMIPILKRVALALPFILGIGILNLFFDKHTVMVGSFTISTGWIIFLSIIIKSLLTVTASILLIATTGMDKLGAAMRMVKVPKIFVLQLLLTYRYISILMEEVSTMSRAYSLRAPGQKGIHRKVWGSLLGQLLLRTYDRAQRIYTAMNLRGFIGEYNTYDVFKVKTKDYIYFISWSLFFIVARFVNIPKVVGGQILGVIR